MENKKNLPAKGNRKNGLTFWLKVVLRMMVTIIAAAIAAAITVILGQR